jgi:hypothetical protein
MFNVDKAISSWRNEAIRSGLVNAAILDELEAHLRDGIDQQLTNGFSVEQSFQIAVQNIGSTISIRTEFDKGVIMKAGKDRWNKIIGAVGFSIYAVFAIKGLFSDLVGATTNEKLLGLAAVVTTGILLFVSDYMWRVVPAFGNKRVRASVAISVAAFYALVTAYLFNFVMPHYDLNVAQVVVATLWSLQPLLVGGAVCAGLMEAAERRPASGV